MTKFDHLKAKEHMTGPQPRLCQRWSQIKGYVRMKADHIFAHHRQGRSGQPDENRGYRSPTTREPGATKEAGVKERTASELPPKDTAGLAYKLWRGGLGDLREQREV